VITVNIKPLSVNLAWQGKRFKTPEYKRYEKAVLLMLPNKIDIPKPPFSLKIEFGLSSKLNDIDNGVKPFVDILQKKYGINDRDIYHLQVLKTIVGKGKEFIKFKIE
jgi:Holliday junction resolvase RusA-like endonuclease